MQRILWLLTLYLGCLLPAGAVLAQEADASLECGQTYEATEGDSLSLIARRAYDDARKWTLIHNANAQAIGDDPSRLSVGSELRIPCLGGGSAQRSLPVAEGKDVTLLSGGNYGPFTNREREDGGLFANLLVAALEQQRGALGSFGFAWDDDWSRHLDPLLTEQVHDLGFPWLKPDCEQSPQRYRCQEFLFSEPMFEMLVVLFVDSSDPISFDKQSDLFAHVLCRPKGYYTHDLEKDGRKWLSQKKVNLWQPDSIDECFDMLVNGGVDAVALNEFTGRAAMHRLGLQDRVEILKGRPISVEGLHVVAHRDHPRAGAMIEAVNRGIAALKEQGEYRDIVDRHLSAYWSRY